MGLSDGELRAVVRLCHEAGHLKRSKRTGWWVAGISDPESVAEHSWRTAVIAYCIAVAEGADPERAATIAVFHDLAETRLGDIEYVGRHYLTAAPDETVTKDQARDLPAALASGLLALAGETAARQTLEAACARDADKLECLLQAREYQRQGHQDVQEWIDNMAAAVRTETGKALAAAALQTQPSEWWREVASLHAHGPDGPRSH
ncbi:MAG TPA: HD domain-containing protein [Streptosporangiaceae bacterium]|nr:HD domain-containing protein [Streptosporangiaceae bacterium]